MYLYVRHGEKLFANGKSPSSIFHSHDPPLTLEGRRLAWEKGEEIVKANGQPTKIFISPFLRCRETAAMMIEGGNVSHEVPIVVLPEIGEYLGNWHGRKIGLDPVTLCFEPVIDNDYGSLKRRVEDHCLKLDETTEWMSEEVYWIVTHGIVMDLVEEYRSGNPKRGKDERPLLSTMSISGARTTLRNEKAYPDDLR